MTYELLAVLAFLAVPTLWGLWEEYKRNRPAERRVRDLGRVSDDWRPRRRA